MISLSPALVSMSREDYAKLRVVENGETIADDLAQAKLIPGYSRFFSSAGGLGACAGAGRGGVALGSFIRGAGAGIRSSALGGGC
jgi:hypothetical protein